MVAGGVLKTPFEAVPGAFEPVVVNRPSSGAAFPLRVVVLNARGGGRIEDIARRLSLAPLAGAAVVMLCEAGWLSRRAHGRRVAAELAAALGMSFVYGPALGRHGGSGEFISTGNAILSAEPLSEVRAVGLPSLPQRKRAATMRGGPTAIIAAAIFAGRGVTLGVTHLHSRWNPAGRNRQMAEFMAAFPAEGPAIVGGDFNTTTIDLDGRWSHLAAACRIAFTPWRFRSPEDHEQLFGRLVERGLSLGGANVPGRATFTPSRFVPPLFRPKLDWLAARGLHPLPESARVVPARASVLSRRFSDHDFVVCDFAPEP